MNVQESNVVMPTFEDAGEGTNPTTSREVREYPPVRAWQIQKFFQLLVETGISDYLKESAEQARTKLTGSQVMEVVGQASEEPQESEEELVLGVGARILERIDMAHILSVMAENGRILELFATVMGHKNPQDAEDIDAQEFADYYPFFAAQSLRPVFSLIGFGGYMKLS